MENLQSRQQLIWIRNVDPSTGRIFYTSTEGDLILSDTSVDFATTASYALNGGGGGGSTDTGSLLTTASFADPRITFTKGDGTNFFLSLDSLVPTSASYATTSSYAVQAGNASTIDINVFGSPVESYLLMSNVAGTTGVAIGGDADLRYNTSTNVLTVGNVSATTLTGSLLGTSSYATQALSSSFATTATSANVVVVDAASDTTTWVLLAGAQTGLQEVKSDAGLTYNASTNALTATTFVGTLTGNASTSTSASYALVASSVPSYETAWTSYTPTWSTDATQPTLGDGSLTGAYKVVGKTCFVRVRLYWGTTTNSGTGTFYFSLPVTASSSWGIQMPASILDNGNAWYQATVNGEYGGFTTKTALIGQSAGGANSSQGITGVFPFTFGDRDSIQFNGSYEIA